jgi:hypothetical protein
LLTALKLTLLATTFLWGTLTFLKSKKVMSTKYDQCRWRLMCEALKTRREIPASQGGSQRNKICRCNYEGKQQGVITQINLEWQELEDTADAAKAAETGIQPMSGQALSECSPL